MRPARVVELVSREERLERRAASPDFGWAMLGWTGAVLAVVGAQDLLLSLLPLGIGNPEWEFGTVTAVLNGMPVLTMGLALLLASAAVRGLTLRVRVLAGALFVLAALILVGFTLYALTIPVALGSVADPGILLGLKKAIAKTAVQAVVYPLAFTALGVAAVRQTQRSI